MTPGRKSAIQNQYNVTPPKDLYKPVLGSKGPSAKITDEENTFKGQTQVQNFSKTVNQRSRKSLEISTASR